MERMAPAADPLEMIYHLWLLRIRGQSSNPKSAGFNYGEAAIFTPVDLQLCCLPLAYSPGRNAFRISGLPMEW